MNIDDLHELARAGKSGSVNVDERQVLDTLSENVKLTLEAKYQSREQKKRHTRKLLKTIRFFLRVPSIKDKDAIKNMINTLKR